MASCQNIIDAAMRRLGILGSGRTAQASEYLDAMDTLTGLYKGLIAAGTFGTMRQVQVSSDYSLGPNEHVFHTQGCRIRLPSEIESWCSGNDLIPNNDYGHCSTWYYDRVIVDCSVARITDLASNRTIEFIYDGQNKQWQSLYDLTLNDQAPLSYRDPEGLKSHLAVLLSSDYGLEINPVVQRQARDFSYNLSSRPLVSHNHQPNNYY